MTKQIRIISKPSDTTVKVIQSSRIQKGMEDGVLLFYRKLLCTTDAVNVSLELAALIEMIGSIFADLTEEGIAERPPSDESVIIDLEREL